MVFCLYQDNLIDWYIRHRCNIIVHPTPKRPAWWDNNTTFDWLVIVQYSNDLHFIHLYIVSKFTKMIYMKTYAVRIAQTVYWIRCYMLFVYLNSEDGAMQYLNALSVPLLLLVTIFSCSFKHRKGRVSFFKQQIHLISTLSKSIVRITIPSNAV